MNDEKVSEDAVAAGAPLGRDGSEGDTADDLVAAPHPDEELERAVLLEAAQEIVRAEAVTVPERAPFTGLEQIAQRRGVRLLEGTDHI
jgi:hypothetical protein